MKEQPQYSKMEIPTNEQKQKVLLRSLFNIRMPLPVNDAFLDVQNAYLQEEIRRKGITKLTELEPIQKDYIFGRVTLLRSSATLL